MYMHFNEDTRVKIPATIHFMKLGYIYQSLKGARIDFETKIFVDIFKSSLEKINNRSIEDDEIINHFLSYYSTFLRKNQEYCGIMSRLKRDFIKNINRSVAIYKKKKSLVKMPFDTSTRLYSLLTERIKIPTYKKRLDNIR